jgi:hypothetical protein
VEAGEEGSTLLGRGRKPLHELDRYVIEARIAGVAGKAIRPYAVEPTAGDLLSTTYKPAATCGEKPQEIRHRTTEEVARAPELER